MIVEIYHQGFGKSDSTWSMWFNLERICELEGRKEEVDIRKDVWKNVVVYPVSRVRKVLKLILQEADIGTVEQVQTYLNEHSKRYGKIFEEMRNKGR